MLGALLILYVGILHLLCFRTLRKSPASVVDRSLAYEAMDLRVELWVGERCQGCLSEGTGAAIKVRFKHSKTAANGHGVTNPCL